MTEEKWMVSVQPQTRIARLVRGGVAAGIAAQKRTGRAP